MGLLGVKHDLPYQKNRARPQDDTGKHNRGMPKLPPKVLQLNKKYAYVAPVIALQHIKVQITVVTSTKPLLMHNTHGCEKTLSQPICFQRHLH